MRVSHLMLCATSLGGCASEHALPVARATAPTSLAAPDTSVEVRHQYVFSPGKRPVLIVDREDTASAPQEVSAEPPGY